MDRRTVFADKLVLPRAIKTLATGVLVGEPPHLWRMRDTNGDLKMDEKELVSDTFGRLRGQPGAQREQPHLGARQLGLHVRARLAPAVPERRLRGHADAQPRAVGRLDRRRRPCLSQRQQLSAVRGLHARPLFHAEPERRADARPLRVADLAAGRRGLAGSAHPRRQSRLPRPGLPARRLLADPAERGHARRLPRRSPARGAAGRRVRHRRHDEHAALVRDRRRRPRPPDRPERLRGRGDLRRRATSACGR